jgi:predicted RNA-binding protein associated with RNAse of E/G family
VQMPDGRVIVMDEDDLEKQFQAGYLSKELKERAKREASQRVEMLREG